jgi:hypothetical protein
MLKLRGFPGVFTLCYVAEPSLSLLVLALISLYPFIKQAWAFG